MEIQFLRHATFVITIQGLRILVDPMLSDAGAMEPIANAGNQLRIPMVPLPLSEAELQQLLSNIDLVLVTHTHRDHWDARAQELLPKQLPLLCQPEDEELFKQAGFSQVVPVHEQLEWQGIQIYRTGGHHGTGELGRKMGPVSGFVLKDKSGSALYISGDTIWCEEVEQALERFAPGSVILYTGAATYVTGGGPITMTDDDVCRVCRAVPGAQVVAIHMEVINHCRLTRAALRKRLEGEGLTDQVRIPPDGAVFSL